MYERSKLRALDLFHQAVLILDLSRDSPDEIGKRTIETMEAADLINVGGDVKRVWEAHVRIRFCAYA